MKNNFKQAFTLVELIVVITILAVLSTIGFVSMTGYTQSSRDATRLSDINNISKAFELQKTREIDFPLPDKKVDISASGSIFQYQGVLSKDILSQINVHGGGKDPQTGEYFGYTVNKKRDQYQIITFLENEENVVNNNLFSKIYANNSNKFPKTIGDILGFFIDQNSHLILQENINTIEIDSDLSNYEILLKNNIKIQKNKISGLQNISLSHGESTCNQLLQNNKNLQNKDGYYILNIGGQPESHYCDMTKDGGGWTLYTGKNKFHLQNYGYVNYDKNFLKGVVYSQIRYNYISPNQTYFPLIYTPFNQHEGNLILGYHSYVLAVDWNKENLHYPDNITFQNAFEIGEGNTSTITIENIRETITEGGTKQMRGRVAPGGNTYHLAMGTAFQRGWQNFNKYLWYPIQPYVGTYRLGDETFSSYDINQAWMDNRSITIWIK